jgi:hypothetical protein
MSPPKRSRKTLNFSLVIVVIIGIGALPYFNDFKFNKYFGNDIDIITNDTPDESVGAAVNSVEDIIKRVGRLVVLPQDEKPTVATVSDLDKLQGQPFFSQAKIGDKVLIYANARKAILYDPLADKVINVAPLNIKNPEVKP